MILYSVLLLFWSLKASVRIHYQFLLVCSLKGNKVKKVCNNLSVSRWWQKFHFWIKYPLKEIFKVRFFFLSLSVLLFDTSHSSAVATPPRVIKLYKWYLETLLAESSFIISIPPFSHPSTSPPITTPSPSFHIPWQSHPHLIYCTASILCLRMYKCVCICVCSKYIQCDVYHVSL